VSLSRTNAVVACMVGVAIGFGTGFSADSLEEKLRSDIIDHRLDNMPHIEAAFVLSGVTEQDSLNRCLNRYLSILQTIRDYRFDSFDRIGSANKVFQYLHSTWLRQYSKESTTLLDILQKKQYNCVSATILFNLLCDDLGWTTEAFETPSHVYTVFCNFIQKVMVENTSPMGFDIIQNLQKYSHFLLQFYPENQALKIGLDRIYVYENSRGRPINNTELLGLLAYNRAYLAEKRGDFSSAYQLVLFAQQFNGDSRSNVDFEIKIFYQWGEALFQKKNFEEALNVYWRGLMRHPDVGDFRSNVRSSFLNGMISAWNDKNWDRSIRMVQMVSGFDFLQEKDVQNLESLFQHWRIFFTESGRNQEAKDAERLFKTISQESK